MQINATRQQLGDFLKMKTKPTVLIDVAKKEHKIATFRMLKFLQIYLALQWRYTVKPFEYIRIVISSINFCCVFNMKAISATGSWCHFAQIKTGDNISMLAGRRTTRRYAVVSAAVEHKTFAQKEMRHAESLIVATRSGQLKIVADVVAAIELRSLKWKIYCAIK